MSDVVVCTVVEGVVERVEDSLYVGVDAEVHFDSSGFFGVGSDGELDGDSGCCGFVGFSEEEFLGF